jgi:hypothetical protein
MKPEPGMGNVFFETKFRGPDGVVFDCSEHPWVGAAPAGVAEAKLPTVKAKETEPAE